MADKNKKAKNASGEDNIDKKTVIREPNQLVTISRKMFLDKFRNTACEEGSDEAAFLFATEGQKLHYSAVSHIDGIEDFLED